MGRHLLQTVGQYKSVITKIKSLSIALCSVRKQVLAPEGKLHYWCFRQWAKKFPSKHFNPQDWYLFTRKKKVGYFLKYTYAIYTAAVIQVIQKIPTYWLKKAGKYTANKIPNEIVASLKIAVCFHVSCQSWRNG